jgi:hypothetical protein
VQDNPASNQLAFFQEITCVSSTQQYMPIFNKGIFFSYMKMLMGREHSFHMLTQVSKGNNLEHTEASMLDGILPADTTFSSTIGRLSADR